MCGFMNEPVYSLVTNKEIVKEYLLYKDIKRVSKVFCISVKDVKEILRENKILK